MAKLLTPLVSSDTHRVHLIMCPFAGGSAGAFSRWRTLAPRGAPAISLVTYPGRDRLCALPAERSIAALADRLAHDIQAQPADIPIVLAGHSMGALVAFETSRRVQNSDHRLLGVAISGCHAPHGRSKRLLSHLNDEAFMAEVIAIGGCPPALLASSDFLALFLPLLRADFYAIESYQRASPGAKDALDVPALLLWGTQDREASADEVAAWQAWLPQAGPPIAMPGSHFYPLHDPQRFIQRIMSHFDSALSSTR